MRIHARPKALFKDRKEAARFLLEKLSECRGLNPLVLAIPRGGVPLGRVVADGLKGELDVVLVHKIGAPGNPEYAIGAVSERGSLYTAPYASHLAISSNYWDEEVRRQVHALELKRKHYTPYRPAHGAANRVVIIVDDGIATGSTVQAAIKEVDAQRPAKVIVAAAVAPPETVELLKQEADEVVVLAIRPDFNAVGEFFEDFSQVTDEEVIHLLKSHV